MVFKRYIKKNGKLIGPYYYESYRDEFGNVKKRYLGSKPPSEYTSENWVTPRKIGVFLVIVLALAFVNYAYESITGTTVFEQAEETIKNVQESLSNDAGQSDSVEQPNNELNNELETENQN